MMTNERLDHLERLLEVVRGLTTAPNIESFLQTVITEASEMTDSAFASILEYDKEAKELRFLSMQWIHRELLRPVGVPIDGSAAGWVFRHAQPLIIQDTRIDQRHFKVPDRVSQYDTRSLAAVPLVVRGEVIGVMESINKKNDAHFTEEDLAILGTLGALAAQAMRNFTLMQDVKRARIELAELERLKSDFIAITSHELRTPLGLILGHATFLREQIEEKHGEQLDIIVRNTTKLKEIVENLADVDNYRKGSSRVRSNQVSMTRIVEDVALTFQDEAKSRNITLQAETGNDPLYMDADGVKVNIALSNLVKNALQFTDPGGVVSITAGEESGYLKVSVTDSGIGIPARDLPRVFERFFQVETHLTRRHGGMGLGLAVTKAMIELHGGRIWVESEAGKGSTFTFLLPVEQTGKPVKANPFTE